MRLFRKIYRIDLQKAELNLEYLEVDNLNELFKRDFEAFQISSLGFFNTVIAKFENTELENRLLLTLELPKKSFYMQLIAVFFFMLIGVGIVLSGEFQATNMAKFIVFGIPVLIGIMTYIYQAEFLREAEVYIKDIVSDDL